MKRFVATLLHLFPSAFRRKFGADMLADFEDRWHENRGWRLATRTVLDLTVAAVSERFSSRLKPIPPPKGEKSMRILLQDLQFAARTLLRTPGFAIVTLLTLALGIGLNTAMFSLAYGVLWRSMPYPRPDRVVMVGEVDGKNPDAYWGTSYLNLLDWRSRSTTFEHLAGMLSDDRVLREGAEPVRVSGLAVTRDFFDVMKVSPALGRVFNEAEDRKGAPPVIVLSHRMWSSRFASDPAILGRSIRFDSATFAVIGVMPASFDYRQIEFWTPLEQVINEYFRSRRTVWVLNAVGRLRDGKKMADAQSEVEGITGQIRQAFPDTNRGQVVRVSPLQTELNRDLRPALIVLLGAVTLVLLIACGNIAALMLVRGTGRAREMAIRSALGGRSTRLFRQLLTESALLACPGGIAGVGISFWATRYISGLTKDPRLLDVHTDTSVLLFAVAATLVTTVLFGIAPAIRATRVDLSDALRSGTRSSSSPERAFVQRALVVAEVALCLALLSGAGLLFKSFRRVLEVQPGFRTEDLVTIRVNLPGTYESVAAVTQLYKRMYDSLAAIPGVTGATLVNRLPISGGEANGDINIESRPSRSGELGTSTFRRVMPNYFNVLGIPLVRGRAFDDRDGGSPIRPVIIDDAFAHRFWPNGDAIGQRIKIGPRDADDWLTIVGVVGSVRQLGLDSDAPYSAYEPLVTHPSARFEVAVRTPADANSMIATVRRQLRSIEPNLLVDNVGTMSQRITDSVASRRLNLVLFGLFAALALGLASVGLYGVVAYAAGQRTQEFGIRMALGARSADVLGLVLGQGLSLALVGVALGLAATLASSVVLTRLLFGVEPADLPTLAVASLILTIVALIASWLPAHRACRIAPIDALRSE